MVCDNRKSEQSTLKAMQHSERTRLTSHEVVEWSVSKPTVQFRDVNEQLCCEIVERKQAEATLKNSPHLLQATLESIAVGIIGINSQGKVVSFNQKFVEMWQVPDAIIVSPNRDQRLAFYRDQLKQPDTFMKSILELDSKPDVGSYDILELKDGRLFQRSSQPLRLGAEILGRIWSIQEVSIPKPSNGELCGMITPQQDKQEWHAPDCQPIPESLCTDSSIVTGSESIFPPVPQLSQVFDFIEANYQKPISLSDVAQAVGYSPAYLTNLVRHQTGKTINLWIIERRLAAARSLLLETDQSVEQIAHRVGYFHVGHFFRQFRQHHRTTPNAWRKAQSQ
jgi:AraC-like DNA-binding protein/PAS domain-containing protein